MKNSELLDSTPTIHWVVVVMFSLWPMLALAQSSSLPSLEPPALGRLLTSVDERLRIDNFRAAKSQIGVDKSLTYRGIVERVGTQWIWLNDQVLPANGDSAYRLNPDHTLTLTVGERSYTLRAGQTLIPSQGLIQDPLR